MVDEVAGSVWDHVAEHRGAGLLRAARAPAHIVREARGGAIERQRRACLLVVYDDGRRVQRLDLRRHSACVVLEVGPGRRHRRRVVGVGAIGRAGRPGGSGVAVRLAVCVLEEHERESREPREAVGAPASELARERSVHVCAGLGLGRAGRE